MNRYYVLLLLCFAIKLAAGQTISSFNRIAKALNEAFEGTELRGQRVSYTISITSEGKIIVAPTSKDSIGIGTLKDLLSRHVDSLMPGRKYYASIYFDEYTAKAYAVFYQPTVQVGFPNYDNYFPQPRGGFKELIQTIRDDLYRHREQLDSVQWEDWYNGITWLIDSSGAVKSAYGGYLDRMLDSAKLIGWIPGIYYGYPMRAIVRIRIDKEFVLAKQEPNTWRYLRDWVRTSYVLPDQYQGKWVRLEKDTPKPSGQTVVSFIFNPVTLQMENPVIHQGPVAEAKEFVTWLEKRQWDTKLFYWKEWPYAIRSYFCLD